MFLLVCVEETVPKSFRVLPQSLVVRLLECFALPFKCKRSRVDAPMKVCEIGMEGSWFPIVCVQKGIKYEGYMLKPQYAPKLLEDLYSSKQNALYIVLLKYFFQLVLVCQCYVQEWKCNAKLGDFYILVWKPTLFY